MKFVDPEGKETYVKELGDDKYIVCGGKMNKNRNIYLQNTNNEFILDDNGERISIGKSMTRYSFYDFNERSWSNAIID